MARIRKKSSRMKGTPDKNSGGWFSPSKTTNDCRKPKEPENKRNSQLCLMAAALLFGLLFVPTSHQSAANPSVVTTKPTTVAPVLRVDTTTATTAKAVVPVPPVPLPQNSGPNPGDLPPECRNQAAIPPKTPPHTAEISRPNGVAKFQISLHPATFDKTDSFNILSTADYYQTAWSAAFDEVLVKHKTENPTKPTRVLDVGANIGFFSLLAAAHGPNVIVDAFEPNQQDRLRLCESLQLNKWKSEYDPSNNQQTTPSSQINIYPYGIGQVEGFFTYQPYANNPARGGFVRTHPQGQGTRVINLDHLARTRGWLASRPDISILKIDAEGLDHFVLTGATQLIKTQMVRNIFVEFSLNDADFTHPHEQERVPETKAAIKLLLEAGYALYKVGGKLGPDKELDLSDVPIIAADRIMEIGQRDPDKKLSIWFRLS